jgi:hypothetical protein
VTFNETLNALLTEVPGWLRALLFGPGKLGHLDSDGLDQIATS